MTQYCITQGNRQQCKLCVLVNGKLINNDGYVFPNCPGTQWVNINPYAGTNGTPVYEVVPMPLDSWTPLLGLALVFIILKNRIR